MNNKKLYTGFLSVTAALALAACGNKQQSSSSLQAPVEDGFKTEVVNEGTPISGGTLNMAQVSNSPFKGLFNPILFLDSGDGSVVNMAFSNLFDYDANQKIDNSKGMADYKLDVENKTFTIHLKKGDYKWSDGEPLTIDDYIFAIEAIGNKDYTGVRYNANYQNIEGMDKFHSGEASSISGVEKLDDYSVKLHFKQMRPSMQLAGGALPYYVMPKHIFSTIPVAEWEKSDYVRGNKGVGLGPFKIESITPGESVTLVPNEHYYKGRAKLDKVVMEVVSPDTIVSQMKAGNYDVASMPSAQYEAYKDLTNVSFISSFASQYEYIAFHLGKYDKEQGKNITDPNAKMKDPVLRQALAYALDINAAGESMYHGLQRGTNSIIIPFFKDIYNANQEGFDYNPEKAKQMLDEAGYKDTDGDGLRENKDGSKLSINFAARTRDDANESLIQQYLLWWKEIGLNVQLVNGRTMEVNSFYDKVEANDPEIDMYTAGWNTGFDPDPTGLYGEDAKFNFTRFVSKEQTDIFNKINSEAAFDDAKNIEFYKEWQKYVHDQAYVFPTLIGDQITAVNKRVKYYSTDIASNNPKNAINEMELVADTPVK